MKKIIYFCVLTLLIIFIIINSFFIYKILNENNEQEELFENLQEQINIKIEKQENNTKEMDLQILYEQNQDLVGWIKIDGTDINYPVMQTKNNPNYYLRKNFYREYSAYGNPFISEDCSIKDSNNLIIYGHHISGKKMFGELESYKNKDFYNKHKIISFYTLKDKYEYEIFSVFKTTTTSNFKYYEYTSCVDEDEYNTYIEKCREMSFYDTKIKINTGDKLLTLSTCDYTIKNGRFVVVAKRI